MHEASADVLRAVRQVHDHERLLRGGFGGGVHQRSVYGRGAAEVGRFALRVRSLPQSDARFSPPSLAFAHERTT